MSDETRSQDDAPTTVVYRDSALTEADADATAQPDTTTEAPADDAAIQAPEEAVTRPGERVVIDRKGKSAKTPKTKKQRSTWMKIAEIPFLVIMAFAIAVVIKTFLVQAFYIPSGSMIPSLHPGDRVLVEKIGSRFGSPARGDVVVFEKDVFGAGSEDLPWWDDARNFMRELLGLPTGQQEDYIKRVVAVGGDVIRYTGSPRKLFINGEQQDQDFVKGGRDPGSPAITKDDCRRLQMEQARKGCRVPAGTVFVMGDNRGNSEDSRVIGPVDEDRIVGKAFLIIWPPGDWGTI